MAGMQAYLKAMIKAMAQRKLLRKNQIGPGEYKTPQQKSVKYDGAVLRASRAQRGVGRPYRPGNSPP